jgi:hypothetical protein
VENVWDYPRPPALEPCARRVRVLAGGELIADSRRALRVAFYPGRMDACYLDEELVLAQPGDFYGGWLSADIAGPVKGGPGTLGW